MKNILTKLSVEIAFSCNSLSHLLTTDPSYSLWYYIEHMAGTFYIIDNAYAPNY